MSQAGKLREGTIAGDIETITGNAGGAVGADALLNVNIVGGTNISITGVPGTHTLTANLIATIPVTLGGTGQITNTLHGILLGNAAAAIQATAEPSNGQLLIGKTGDFPQLANITPGAGIAVSSGAGTITIGAWGGGMSWTTKGASTPLVVNNAFICTAGAALSFSLPAISSVGDLVALTLDGSTSWTITQGAGQQIRISGVQTTLGAGGSITSTAQGDTVYLVCSVASTKWNVVNVIGNITVV